LQRAVGAKRTMGNTCVRPVISPSLTSRFDRTWRGDSKLATYHCREALRPASAANHKSTSRLPFRTNVPCEYDRAESPLDVQSPLTPIRQFVEDYRRLRFVEGFASADPNFARRLPFRDTTGRNPAAWRLRALHYVVIRIGLDLLRGIGGEAPRVLDLGAGNGWLARRLAGRYRVTALDVDATDLGLAAIDDPRVSRIRGDIEALPVGEATFDVVVAAAALHYAVDLSRALTEIARVLRPGGLLVVADSPFYADNLARHRAWQRTLAYYTDAGAAHLAWRYRGLTRLELDAPRLFRFVTMSPGLSGGLGRLRGREGGPRLPVIFGWKQ